MVDEDSQLGLQDKYRYMTCILIYEKKVLNEKLNLHLGIRSMKRHRSKDMLNLTKNKQWTQWQIW